MRSVHLQIPFKVEDIATLFLVSLFLYDIYFIAFSILSCLVLYWKKRENDIKAYKKHVIAINFELMNYLILNTLNCVIWITCKKVR